MTKDEKISSEANNWITNVFTELNIPLSGKDGAPEHLAKVLFIEAITKALAAGNEVGLKHLEMERIALVVFAEYRKSIEAVIKLNRH